MRHVGTTRIKWVAAAFVTGWMGAMPLAGGCAESAPPAAKDADGPISGAEIVRGMLGVARDGSGDPESRAAADAVVTEIDRAHEGRLEAIGKDLRSRDPDRVIAAKALLDESIEEAANSPTLGQRVERGTSLVGSSLHFLADPPGSGTSLVNGTPTSVVDGGATLVDGGVRLVCEQPRGADGQPLQLGRGSNGRFGDDRTGALGALRDTGDLVDTTDLWLPRTLRRIDSGELTPDPDSRLGAYAATRGYPPGTVGNSVHNAIGTIYLTLGNYGEERIGRVFNSPEAKALYDQPVSSCAGRQMAMLEHQYWSDVAKEDPYSPGGQLGSAFSPNVRDVLQRRVFNR